jgi:fluoroacetyl-CoA thioesterase
VKNPFSIGDTKVYETLVTEDKLARFDAGLVHSVYSTFALGKDVEWACRLFVLEMKETGEEGIGSYLSIEHLYPAPLGSTVKIEATVESLNGNEIVCSYQVFANGFLIAQGRQGQKVINKAKFDSIIHQIKIK